MKVGKVKKLEVVWHVENITSSEKVGGSERELLGGYKYRTIRMKIQCLQNLRSGDLMNHGPCG